MTIQEQIDAYIVFLKDQRIVNDDMSLKERIDTMSDAIYQWLVDNNIEIICNLPRKV
jgi:hypothetical protein